MNKPENPATNPIEHRHCKLRRREATSLLVRKGSPQGMLEIVERAAILAGNRPRDQLRLEIDAAVS